MHSPLSLARSAFRAVASICAVRLAFSIWTRASKKMAVFAPDQSRRRRLRAIWRSTFRARARKGRPFGTVGMNKTPLFPGKLPVSCVTKIDPLLQLQLPRSLLPRLPILRLASEQLWSMAIIHAIDIQLISFCFPSCFDQNIRIVFYRIQG